MPRPDSPPLTRGVVLRSALLTVAIALGGVAVWLIVTSTTRKWMEIGVLAGLWAALVGAFAMFGPRRFMHPLDVAEPPAAGTSLELRSMRTELERAEEAAARRAHEAQLEHMLRREIRAAVTSEVSALRAEIAQLRSELLEKVGGQLRLERIETTRVIGSDLEALQHEVRQLKAVAAQEADLGIARTRAAEAVRQIVEPARVRPVTRQTAEIEADVQPARTFAEPQSAPPAPPAPPPPPAPAPQQEAPAPPPVPPAVVPASTPAPAPVAAQEEAPQPAPAPVAAQQEAPQPAPVPVAAQQEAPQPAPAPVAAQQDAPQPAQAVPVPPVETTGPIRSAPVDAQAEGATSTPTPRPQPAPTPEPVVLPLQPAPRPASDEFAGLPRIQPFTDFELDPVEPDSSAYTGRRRRVDEEPGAGPDAADEESGRRHRRAEDSSDDLLARLLAREGR